MLLSMESTSNRMSRLGKSLVTGTELLSLEELVERIDAVSAENVAALAAELMSPERFSAAGIGPSARRFRAAVERVNPMLVAAAAA
jgi:predicted Zn-dependent peptidase